MMLVMKQADTYYEGEVLDVKRLDEERDLEMLTVYAYPEAPGSNKLEVEVTSARPSTSSGFGSTTPTSTPRL